MRSRSDRRQRSNGSARPSPANRPFSGFALLAVPLACMATVAGAQTVVGPGVTTTTVSPPPGGTATIVGGTIVDTDVSGDFAIVNTNGSVVLDRTHPASTGAGIELRTDSPTANRGLGIFVDARTNPAQVRMVTGTQLTVLTGGERSYGVYAMGANAIGGQPILSLADAAIGTGGTGASAVVVTNGASGVLERVQVVTTGDQMPNREGAYGLTSQVNATLAVSDSTVATTGLGAAGVLVHEATATAQRLRIVTTGASAYGANFQLGGNGDFADIDIETRGTGSIGLRVAGVDAAPVSTFNGSNVRIATAGDNAWGMLAREASTSAISGLDIATQGQAAHGVFGFGPASRAALDTVTIATAGAGAHGVVAASGAGLTLAGGSIATAGTASYGVNVVAAAADPALATARLTDIAVTTQGDAAHALAVLEGGTLTLSGTSAQASGLGAAGLLIASGNGYTGVASITGGAIASARGPAIGVGGGIAQISLDGTQVSSPGYWLHVGQGAVPGANSLSLDFARPHANAEAAFPAFPDTLVFGSELETTSPTTAVTFAPSTATIAVSRSAISGAALTEPGNTANVAMTSGSSWLVTGDSNLTNLSVAASSIDFAPPPPGGAYKTLRVANYAGANGRLTLNTFLGSDGSPSDRLQIDGGTATGTTALDIRNTTGPGALTTGDGIRVVQGINGGTTASGAFALGTRVVAGPYEYALYRGGASAATGEDWFLRSTLDCTLSPTTPPCEQPGPGPGPAPAPAPNFRQEVALYSALPAMALLYGHALLDTLHERVGEQEQLRGRAAPGASPYANGAWGRIIGAHGRHAGDPGGAQGGDGPRYDYDFYGAQIGMDLFRREREDGRRDHAGIYGAVGYARSDVDSFAGGRAGTNRLDAYTLGGYWTHYTRTGAYVDAILQGTWYDGKAESTRDVPNLDVDAFGWAASLEGGYPLPVRGDWVVEPQAQLVYQNIRDADGNDGAAQVRFSDMDSLAGRLGVRLARTVERDGDPERLTTGWLRASVWREFRGEPRTAFSSSTGFVPFTASIDGSWWELKGGVTAQLTRTASLFGSIGYQRAFGDDSYAFEGKVGLRFNW